MNALRETAAPALRFADLFCGVGGFRLAMQNAAAARGLSAGCVFSSDIDAACRETYAANFGETPSGDINGTSPGALPDFDILLAGFPCQPFSIIGKGKGFDDMRGTLFFNIADMLRAKRPRAFALENVKQLRGHGGGRTLSRIMEAVRSLGYHAEWRVLNALDFGLPQNRERIFIIGALAEVLAPAPRHAPAAPGAGTLFGAEPAPATGEPAAPPRLWPARMGKIPMQPLSEILEPAPAPMHDASLAIRIRRAAQTAGVADPPRPGIWHENKSGHIGIHPFSCALRANSSHNYLLVDGVRRLTAREMFRLQGFPDDFKIPKTYSIARRQAGNSLPVPAAQAAISALLGAMRGAHAPACAGSGF